MNIVDRKISELNIEKILYDLLYYEDSSYLSLEWGMNYITFAPCKRVRPLLLLETNKIFKEIDNDSYILAATVELIHTYSLVHDDLPCMDNDELRRGLKTLHVVKDEAYALLIGDALLTKAFGMLSQYSKINKLNEILYLIYDKSGEKGMILGQYLDIYSDSNLDLNDINRINKHKTANLIELSMLLGAINGGASNNDLKVIEFLGEVLGFIFQIKDDILDVEGKEEAMGKPVDSDQKNKKSCIVNLFGIEKAKELLLKYKNMASNIIEKLPSNKEFFFEFLDFLINRDK
ncbi:MAG TPA: polyprenyl synthetase family protein [Spirochaetota bacterium]|nr:polyprenyl synthetase family protein [Spirochaetota bacterium]HOL57566.1 polyprenyl synthetase family protein [Spirochaetota bacterium]HPP05122.1 polyprenyl synthetase family protein [Spirochaetota bacterium]